MSQVSIEEMTNVYVCTPVPQHVPTDGTVTFVNDTDNACVINFGSTTGGCSSLTVAANNSASCKVGAITGNFAYSCTPQNTSDAPGSGIIIVDPPKPQNDQGQDDNAQR